MQLALAFGSADPRLRIAGVALLGAGVIAVTPLAPSLSDVSQRLVQLTSAADGTEESANAWTDLFATTSDNMDSLSERISADPMPVLSQLFENQSGYFELFGSNLKDSLEGVQGIFTGDGPAVGLVDLWPEVMEDISNGDLWEAYGKINTDFLFDLLNIFQPYFDHVPHGTDDFIEGAFGAPAQMLQSMSNVSEVFADFSFWKSLAHATMAPLMGMNFEMTDVFSEFNSELADGDTSGAFETLTNGPAAVLDALFNGYILPGETERTGEFPGLFTEGGTFDKLFVDIPEQIAEALGAGATDSTDDTVDETADGAAALGLDLADVLG